MPTLLAVAFVAGVVTALSPCVLPAIPVVLAGAAGGGRRRVAGIAAGFAVTFTAATLAMAAALRALGLGTGALRWVGIGALAAFGLALLLPPLGGAAAAALGSVARLGERIPRDRSGLGGGLLVGAALALVWTPCAGPVMGAVAAVAATGEAGPAAVAVLGAYSAGAALPLVLVGLGGRRALAAVGPRARGLLRPALGALMAATALVVALGADARVTAALARDVPAYTEALQALERAPGIERELAGLRRGAASEIPPFLAAARGSRPGGATDALGLPDAGPAPELAGVTAGFNTDGRPLRLAGLRGRVVLVDFWTYSCVNCLRTLPHLTALDRRYRADGLTVVGVHTPEFVFEADPGNVGRAVRELGIRYPVVLDPAYETWDAFGTRYWPTTYLIDRRGHVRDLHVGEGDEAGSEDLVRRALGVPDDAPRAEAARAEAPPPHDATITPETWLGADRIRRLAAPQALRPGEMARYRAPARLPADHVAFDGAWLVGPAGARAGRGAALELAFRARRVNLVLEGGRGSAAGAGAGAGRVTLDGRPPRAGERGRDVGRRGRLALAAPRMYRLVDLPRSRAGRLRVELPPGTRAYAFSFGA